MKRGNVYLKYAYNEEYYMCDLSAGFDSKVIEKMNGFVTYRI